MAIFVAKPIEVEALYFDGENFEQIQEFCGAHPSSANEWMIDTFAPIGTYFMSTNPGHVAELWVEMTHNWVGVPARVWIVKTDQGYICLTSEAFRNHYTMKTMAVTNRGW